jgi:hypothetical protein
MTSEREANLAVTHLRMQAESPRVRLPLSALYMKPLVFEESSDSEDEMIDYQLTHKKQSRSFGRIPNNHGL